MSPIANMLIQLKNAQNAGHERVVLPFSKLKANIAVILKEKGFISEIDKKKKKSKKSELEYLDIALNYGKEPKGAIHGIQMVSKPSRRVYVKKTELLPVLSGYGISIVSTSKGLMAGDDARKASLGGELICKIW